jgi:hypothetical protein
MDTEDATSLIDQAIRRGGSKTYWANNTPGTLRVTFENGTVAIVTVEVQ